MNRYSCHRDVCRQWTWLGILILLVLPPAVRSADLPTPTARPTATVTPGPAMAVPKVTPLAAAPTPLSTVRPRKREPESSPTPGTKYYKMENGFLILGIVDRAGNFIEDKSVKRVDLTKEGMPMFLHHDFLPGTFDKDYRHKWSNEYGDFEDVWDGKTHEWKQYFRPKK